MPIKTLLICSLLLLANRWPAQAAPPPDSDTLLYQVFVERGAEALSEALDSASEELCHAFFADWRQNNPPTGAGDPLIDTIYRHSTDINLLNRLGASLKPGKSPARYRLLFPTTFCILPDTIPLPLVGSIDPQRGGSVIRMVNPDLVIGYDSTSESHPIIWDTIRYPNLPRDDLPLTVCVKGPPVVSFYPQLNRVKRNVTAGKTISV